MATDPVGNVWVVDRELGRLQKFSPSGVVLGTIRLGGLWKPHDVAVDIAGQIYTVATLEKKNVVYIKKYSKDGRPLASWPTSMDYLGSCITVDESGTIFASDWYQDRIHVYAPNGTEIRSWRSFGTGDGETVDITGLAPMGSSYLYLSDGSYYAGAGEYYENCRVTQFSKEGRFIRSFGGPTQFSDPSDIAIGPKKEIFVVDQGKCSVQKFTRNGDFITKWTVGSSKADKRPQSVAVSPDGSVFVSLYTSTYGKENLQILKYTPVIGSQPVTS
jgi:streptogramin lyase